MVTTGELERQIELVDHTLHLIQKGWTKGTPAKDASGGHIDPFQRGAASFCFIGAWSRSMKDLDLQVRDTKEATYWLTWVLPHEMSIPRWNDDPKTNKENVTEVLTEVRNRLAEELQALQDEGMATLKVAEEITSALSDVVAMMNR